MQPKKAISTFIDGLNSRIPPPVHTAGIEGSRPVPAVLIENLSIDEKNYHNSHYVGSNYDVSGNVESEVYRHHYHIRFELQVRSDDEPQAFEYLGQLQQALGELSRDPRGTIHDDVNGVEALGSGGVSYQFYEPTETEINQTVLLKTFYDSEDSDLDIIGSVGTDYTFS